LISALAEIALLFSGIPNPDNSLSKCGIPHKLVEIAWDICWEHRAALAERAALGIIHISWRSWQQGANCRELLGERVEKCGTKV